MFILENKYNYTTNTSCENLIDNWQKSVFRICQILPYFIISACQLNFERTNNLASLPHAFCIFSDMQEIFPNRFTKSRFNYTVRSGEYELDSCWLVCAIFKADWKNKTEVHIQYMQLFIYDNKDKQALVINDTEVCHSTMHCICKAFQRILT